MLRSAHLAPTLHNAPVERKGLGHALRGRIFGSVAIAVIYSVAIRASVGLFRASPASPHRAASMLLGVVNVVVLPVFMLAAVIGIRRIWLDRARNPRLSRLLMAPLWASFILSLLTVPLWMGMANVERQGSTAAPSNYSATFLLAPWGFMLAYGLSLFVACAMFDFTFPFAMETKPEPHTAGLG